MKVYTVIICCMFLAGCTCKPTMKPVKILPYGHHHTENVSDNTSDEDVIYPEMTYRDQTLGV